MSAPSEDREQLYIKLPAVSPGQLAQLHDLEEELTFKEGLNKSTQQIFWVIKADYFSATQKGVASYYKVDVGLKINMRYLESLISVGGGGAEIPILNTTLPKIFAILGILPTPTATELKGLSQGNWGFRTKATETPKKQATVVG